MKDEKKYDKYLLPVFLILFTTHILLLQFYYHFDWNQAINQIQLAGKTGVEYIFTR